MRDNIKRFNYISDPGFYGMELHHKGEYVMFSDHENRVVDLMDDLLVQYDKPDQSKIIVSLEAENEILRNEIKQLRTISEIKGCFCKRKFVKQIPSLILNENLILKEKEHENKL